MKIFNKLVAFTIIVFCLSAACTNMQDQEQEQNLTSSKYTVLELQKVLIPQAQWMPFPRINDKESWSTVDQTVLDGYVKSAETYLDYDWPTIPATLSLLIVRTGNRNRYEAVSFQRRNALAALLLGEIAENKGRFVDQIIDGVWSICEESWWGVSAHLNRTNEFRDTGEQLFEESTGLMDVSKPFVDLFAGETGALLSWVDYFLGDKLDAVSPIIRKRIYNEVNYRIMEPLMTQRHGWMGKTASGRGPSNWNPWIVSNWINCVLLLEKDDARRAKMTHKALQVLDEFINPYPQDGGCDEGPSYWGAAAASLFDNLELLNLASNNAFGYVYEDERFRNMGRFIYKAQISENYFINFADAGPRIGVGGAMVYRYGKAIKDQTMMDFGAYYRRDSSGEHRSAFSRTHFFRNFFELFSQKEFQNANQGLPFLRDVWLPDIQVMATRDIDGSTNGFYLAAKGGHNDESHNHNDIGNYLVYYNGYPLLVDIGSGTYTSRTFDDSQRYDIWFNCSDFHNVPTINGITQRAGITYRASDINYSAGDANVEFSLDIAGAYPAEAGVNSWKRSFIINRGQGIKVKDVSDLQKAESITQHLMTCYPAEVTAPGEITIHYHPANQKAIDFVVKYDPQQMIAAVEKIKFELEEDRGVLAKWGDNLYRINIEVIEPKLKDSYLFEIKEK